jgi:arsenate reductase (glutaredoxin)
LLEENGVEFEKRNLAKDPLSEKELRQLLKRLGVRAADALRKKDPNYAKLGLTGKESDAVLIRHMLRHPGLIQRPIGVHKSKAIVARPVEKLLDLA